MLIDEENLESRDTMKLEAEKRMKALKLPDHVIDKFLKEDRLTLSDRIFFSDVPEDILKKIQEYESKFKNLVYHVIHSNFMGMETYECLTVSPYKDDWSYEFPDEKMQTMSHSINITIPGYSESGSIRLGNMGGLLFRIG